MTAIQPSAGQALRDIVARMLLLLRSWRPIALAGLAGTLLGVTASVVRPKSYDAGGIYVLINPTSGSLRLGSLGALASQFGLSDLAKGGGFDANTLARLATSDRTRRTLVARMDSLAAHDSGVASPWYNAARRPEKRSPKRQEALLRRMLRMTDVGVDARSSTIDLGATARTPDLALTMATTYIAVVDSLAADLLTGQMRLVREEAERQVTAAEADLRAAEDRLTRFLSHNRAISSPVLEFEIRALEREANVRATLYQQIASRLAEARLEEKRGTPALLAVSPPRLPVRPSGPGALALAILGAFFGAATAAVLIVWTRPPQPIG
jgi:uncharacterized protein involved in exopolysaccharide biosynthesis